MTSRIRLLLAPALLAACMGGAYLGWQAWQSGRALNALSEVVQSMDMEAILRGKVDALPGGKKEGGDTVDLALRGISLSEGENGFELWRLRAAWATLRQEADKVDLSSPHVQYRMGDGEAAPDDPAAYLDVTALGGLIEEGNSRVTLRGDVRAVHDGNVLTGPEAVFLNNTRVLTFPEGAALDGPTLSGQRNSCAGMSPPIFSKAKEASVCSGRREAANPPPPGLSPPRRTAHDKIPRLTVPRTQRIGHSENISRLLFSCRRPDGDASPGICGLFTSGRE